MPHPVKTLVVATKNPSKVRELRALLADLPLELRAAEEMPDVDETGVTFAENAELKARAAAAWAGAWALADDSGLEVDALGGAPGVHSNRYWEGATTEEERNACLLRDLRDVPPERRTARYRAVVAIAAPDGRVWLNEGACEGVLLDAPRGTRGFGYDPLFYLPAHGRTMAELEPETKNRISHRARALAGARAVLERLCAPYEPD